MNNRQSQIYIMNTMYFIDAVFKGCKPFTISAPGFNLGFDKENPQSAPCKGATEETMSVK